MEMVSGISSRTEFSRFHRPSVFQVHVLKSSANTNQKPEPHLEPARAPCHSIATSCFLFGASGLSIYTPTPLQNNTSQEDGDLLDGPIGSTPPHHHLLVFKGLLKQWSLSDETQLGGGGVAGRERTSVRDIIGRPPVGG